MSTIIVALLFILIVVIVIPVNILMLLIYLYSGYALQRSLFTMILLLILHGISGLLFGKKHKKFSHLHILYNATYILRK